MKFLCNSNKSRAEAAEFILNQSEARIVTVEEPTRSNVRNAQLHAVIGDVAAQMVWDGEKLSIEQWKRLLVAAWMRATDRPIKLARAIDGTGFDPIYQRTSRLYEGECRELIQFIYAWGVEQGVRFKEPGERAASRRVARLCRRAASKTHARKGSRHTYKPTVL